MKLKIILVVVVVASMIIYLNVSCNKASIPSSATSIEVQRQIEQETNEDKLNKIFSAKGIGNLLIDSVDADRCISNFERRIRTFNKKISRSVWMDTSVLRFIVAYMDTGKTKISGIRIHMMQYDDEIVDNIPGRKYERQTSIVIIPTITKETGGGTSPEKDDWAAWDKYREEFKKWLADKSINLPKSGKEKLTAGLNHGTLCPDICP